MVTQERAEEANGAQDTGPSTIYTKEALSSQGTSSKTYRLRLLCDDDIICHGKIMMTLSLVSITLQGNCDINRYGKQKHHLNI